MLSISLKLIYFVPQESHREAGSAELLQPQDAFGATLDKCGIYLYLNVYLNLYLYLLFVFIIVYSFCRLLLVLVTVATPGCL